MTRKHEHIDNDIKLLIQGDTYHARLRIWEDGKSSWKYKSTKIKVSEGDARDRAIKKARRLLFELEERQKRGLPLRQSSFKNIAEACLRDWREKALLNEERYKQGDYNLDHYEAIEFGKRLANEKMSVWRMNTFTAYRQGIKEFQSFLSSIGKSKIPINDIDDRLFERFITWRNKNRPKRAKSTLEKYRVGIRKVFFTAVENGEILTRNLIPMLSYEKASYEKAKTKYEANKDDVKALLDYTLQRAKRKKEQGYEDWHRYYQFHLQLGMIANSGIRPPSTPKNCIQDKHFKKDKGLYKLQRHDMKGISYDSATLPQFKTFYDNAIQLKKDFKVKSPYTICHLFDRGKIQKGKPILDWRKQLTHALEALEIPNLTLYSLRHFYISEMLDSGNADIPQIARATGTSPEQIEATYYRKQLQEEAYKRMMNTNLGLPTESIS